MPKIGLDSLLTVFRMLVFSRVMNIGHSGNLFMDIIYKTQASRSLQTWATQTSYEHLKFNCGACSAMFYLCLEQKNGWCPLPWATSPGCLVSPDWSEAWVLPTSAKPTISGHCSEAQILTSEFLGLITWVSEALIGIHRLAVKHVWVQY